MSDMTGKVVMITGSNSGIGKETALELARQGATIVMVVRNREKGEEARGEIIEETGNQDIDILISDFSEMSQVRELVSKFKEKYARLDVLVNNAGGIFGDRIVTSERNEYTLALNYLAPILLTNELLGVLVSSGPSRIINVSSAAHNFGKYDLENIQLESGYGSMRAYSNAKLLIIMHTYKLAERLEGTNVIVNALHPGFVRTNFGSGMGLGSRIFMKLAKPFAKSSKKGAQTPIYLALSPEVENTSGKYFVDNKPRDTKKVTYEKKLQDELWDWTNQTLNLTWSIVKSH